MSRARDKGEQEMLRSLRSSKKINELVDGKSCANISCSSLGSVIAPEFFYKGRGGKGLDSYCANCRKARSDSWRSANPEYKYTGPKRTPVDWEPNLGKAPWCEDHQMNSAKCGCVMGARFHKTPTHKARIAEAMKGKKNAFGNKSRAGMKMSSEHRFKISLAVSETLRKKRREHENP